MKILLMSNFISDENRPKSEEIGLILKLLSYDEVNMQTIINNI